MRELRENGDGSVSVMHNGKEILRGKPPGKHGGLEGLRRLYEVNVMDALRRLRGELVHVKRLTFVDTIAADIVGDEDVRLVATWEGGEFDKTYGMRDIPRSCRLRRYIVRDILEARMGGEG